MFWDRNGKGVIWGFVCLVFSFHCGFGARFGIFRRSFYFSSFGENAIANGRRHGDVGGWGRQWVGGRKGVEDSVVGYPIFKLSLSLSSFVNFYHF